MIKHHLHEINYRFKILNEYPGLNDFMTKIFHKLSTFSSHGYFKLIGVFLKLPYIKYHTNYERHYRIRIKNQMSCKLMLPKKLIWKFYI